jgi:acyl carrier protein
MDMDALERELQDLVIEVCNVTDPPAEVAPDAPLIGPDSPFGLDSLDAVEVVVAVQKRFEVRIGSQETSREVLRSLRTLAEYIRKERPAQA